MVKPLSFKGDPKPKKRKRIDAATKFGVACETSETARNADAESVGDDTWVSAEAASDLAGPVVIVLPSAKPACLACDSNGTVFPSLLENVVDDNPATAEPHDVRQVWVVTRVAGTDHISFKGHHGKYLSCDKFGALSAETEAVSPRESFLVFPTASTPGTFQIQTLNEQYITIAPSSKTKELPEIRGDASDVSFDTTLRIRMQARFKPKLKRNKEEKASQSISRQELERAVGRKLEDVEVRKLKKARREGDYHEALLDLKVKGKHDKYS